MDVTIESNSPQETEALAKRIAVVLPGGILILLSGELGAGKTCFVRGLARGLNMPPEVAVTSPTYVLQHIYRGGRLTVYHIDAYRLMGGAEEFEASGLRECMADAGGVVCMEWPEKVPGEALNPERLEIGIEHADIDKRVFTIKAFGAKAAQILKTAAFAI